MITEFVVICIISESTDHGKYLLPDHGTYGA